MKSKTIRWTKQVAQIGDRKYMQIFESYARIEETTSTLRSRCEDNIKIDNKKIGLDGVYWIYLLLDREGWLLRVNTVMNLRVV